MQDIIIFVVRSTPLCLFIQGRPLGHLDPSSQICIFETLKLISYLNIFISRDLSREMTHPKECIEVRYGSNFNFGESTGARFFFMLHEKKSNSAELAFVMEIRVLRVLSDVWNIVSLTESYSLYTFIDS